MKYSLAMLVVVLSAVSRPLYAGVDYGAHILAYKTRYQLEQFSPSEDRDIILSFASGRCEEGGKLLWAAVEAHSVIVRTFKNSGGDKNIISWGALGQDVDNIISLCHKDHGSRDPRKPIRNF